MEQRKIKMSPYLLGAIEEGLGRMPCTPYDLTKCKKLTEFNPVDFYYDVIPEMVEEAEGDFLILGEMPNLHTLKFSNFKNEHITVNDFSFLAKCQKLKTLDLTNTNFSDCSILLNLPNLKKVYLPDEEMLVSKEALNELLEKNVQVFTYSKEERQLDEEYMENLFRATAGDRMNAYNELMFEMLTAIKNILTDLFKNNEHYYYITLVSDGLANTPCISAWSYEALERSGADSAEKEMIKWSYADSPYCCFRQEKFSKVENILLGRGKILDLQDDAAFNAEYDMRYMAMETAMSLLDKEGLFEITQNRDEVVVLVETMPPDYTNTQRAYRMNSRDSQIFKEWLIEAAE